MKEGRVRRFDRHDAYAIRLLVDLLDLAVLAAGGLLGHSATARLLGRGSLLLRLGRGLLRLRRLRSLLAFGLSRLELGDLLLLELRRQRRLLLRRRVNLGLGRKTGRALRAPEGTAA